MSPRLTDLGRVRARLERDRAWSAYALGDLSPAFAPYAEWRATPDDEALVLVYREFATPIVFAIGAPVAVQPLLQEIEAPEIALQIQPGVTAMLAPGFDLVATHPMWRMQLERAAFVAPDLAGVERLGRGDADDIRDLYADGDVAGEAPDFFMASMLDAGCFRGIREDGRLVAAAGTHIVAADVGVCAIGNVYTRRDRRGRGYGRLVTAAVVVEALARRIPTVVLNVRHKNVAARRVYERLGFVARTDFVEGVARRVGAGPDATSR